MLTNPKLMLPFQIERGMTRLLPKRGFRKMHAAQQGGTRTNTDEHELTRTNKSPDAVCPCPSVLVHVRRVPCSAVLLRPLPYYTTPGRPPHGTARQGQQDRH